MEIYYASLEVYGKVCTESDDINLELVCRMWSGCFEPRNVGTEIFVEF